jgi:hypothetical protein
MDSSGKAQDRAPWESVGMLPAAYLRQKLTKPLVWGFLCQGICQGRASFSFVGFLI